VAEYEAALDDFFGESEWMDPPLEVLNQERWDKKKPNLTAIQDATCWMGWEQTEFWMMRDLGFLIPHFQSEGGVTPKARAGTGENQELRYVYPTPKDVARKTLDIYRWNSLPDRPAHNTLFAICPWILASEHLGCTGWYTDCWLGGAFYDKYGFEKPVYWTLKDNPPSQCDPAGARDKVSDALASLGGALVDLEEC